MVPIPIFPPKIISETEIAVKFHPDMHKGRIFHQIPAPRILTPAGLVPHPSRDQ